MKWFLGLFSQLNPGRSVSIPNRDNGAVAVSLHGSKNSNNRSLAASQTLNVGDVNKEYMPSIFETKTARVENPDRGAAVPPAVTRKEPINCTAFEK